MSFSRVTVYFFSGTGNSFRVANIMCDLAGEKGLQTALIPIESAQPGREIVDDGESLVGIINPTHGFTCPWHMLKFVARLPRAKSTYAFCAATRAGLKVGPFFTPGISGSGTFILAMLLKLKGYKVLGIESVDMPSNWLACHPGLSIESANAIIYRARGKAERFMARVLKRGKNWLTRTNLYEALWAILLFPVSLGYMFMGRFFLAKLFFASNRCNACGLCVKNCPVGAVKMWGGKPFWSYKCESCMRCMAYCRPNAIEAGHSWAVILYFITTFPVSLYLLEYISSMLGWQTPFRGFGFLIDISYYFVSLFITYYLFMLLTRVPPINALFAYTTLTRLYRRYHEPQTTPEDLRVATAKTRRQKAKLEDDLPN